MWTRDIRKANCALVAVVLLLVPVAAQASVTEVALKDLVARSDLIVVVTVTKVEDGPAGIKAVGDEFPPVKVATARVVETGRVPPYARFVSWPRRRGIATSRDAKEGEKHVLFLEKRGDSSIMMIAHVGRGGMQLHDVGGKPYATLSNQVILPEGTKTISETRTITFDIPRLSTESDKKSPGPRRP